MRWLLLAAMFAGCAHEPSRPASTPPQPEGRPTPTSGGASGGAVRAQPTPGGPFDFTVRDAADGGADAPGRKPPPTRVFVPQGAENPPGQPPFSQ